MTSTNRIDIFEENIKLKEENIFLEKQVKEWKKNYIKLLGKFQELEKKLNQFLNSNTPSSAYPVYLKPTLESPNRLPKGTNPRGKPKGSKGATRKLPTEADETVEVIANKCPNGHTDIEEINSYSRFIYEINQIVLNVTEYKIKEYRCNKEDCGLVFEATHPGLPSQGMIGPNLQALTIELKHNFAGSYGRISTFLEDLTGSTFSAQALNNCIHRVADQLEPSYVKLENEIKSSEVVGSDETSWPVNGKRWWLWHLSSPNAVFLTIDKSRGRKVITNILSMEFKGVLRSDCLGVYREFAIAFQKCWTHLLRKTHHYKEKYPKKDISKLHNQLTNLYNNVTAFLGKDPPFEQRVWYNIMYQHQLRELTYHTWKSDPAKSIVKNYLKAFAGQWLVGVIMPEVGLTNNENERGIRKVIPTRKLLGGHRTEQGAKDFAIIESHRQTWKLKNESPYKKIIEYLTQQNIAA